MHPREPGLRPAGRRVPSVFTAASVSAAPPAQPPRIVSSRASAGVAGRDELLAGLSAPGATMAPKYFYDTLGSALFEAITELDEYYPTRTERAILAAHDREIAAAFGRTGCALIDLGAGNGEKAARLFPVLRPREYVLFVGRLVPENCAHHLVEAWRQLDTDMQCVIVGDAPYAEAYKAELRRLAIRPARAGHPVGR